MKIEKRIKLTEAEVRHLSNSLQWGDRKEFANIIGYSQPRVTQLFKPKNVYNVDTQKFEESYTMDESVYNKLIAYIARKNG